MKKNFQKTLADSLVAHQSQLEQTNFKNLPFKGLGHNISVNSYSLDEVVEVCGNGYQVSLSLSRGRVELRLA